MLKVIELFAGIGSQVKALNNKKIPHKVINIVEWDIYAIVAYDLIHNGKQDLEKYNNISKDKIINDLLKYTLSRDGATPLTELQLSKYSKEVLIRILSAINRTNNLVSIKDVKGQDIPKDLDILTYSFPCQDLSVSGYFHGDSGGINRDANNSSSMLWEVERILIEMKKDKKTLPRFLLMENVPAIKNSRHKPNFDKWKNSLKSLGYVSHDYDLQATDFGIPQSRTRTFMISVRIDNKEEKKIVNNYLTNNLFEEYINVDNDIKKVMLEKMLNDIIKIDYSNPIYKKEALSNIPNNTASRIKIGEMNPRIVDIVNNEIIFTNCRTRTLTTKQDRHPNSGVITHNFKIPGKTNYRFITPRESMMLMGFEEQDYDILINNNFYTRKNALFFTKERITKMTGNSIVVNVLEAVFEKINEINNLIS